MISLWRQYWADRENARRQAEYDKAALAWQQDLEQIRRYHRLSITAGPAINTSGITLQHGENLWWTTTSATLVEAPRKVELLVPDHNSYSPTGAGDPAMPRGTVRDNGFAAITNQRVLFFGALGPLDWSFSHLTGIAHGTKETLMRVENSRALRGLGVAPALTAAFRFHLALALAEHRDDREGFTDYLAELLERQQSHGLRRPVRALPGRVPRPLLWALATAVLLACGLGLATVPNLDRQASGINLPRPSHPADATPTPFGTPVGMPVGPLGPEAPHKQVPPEKGSSAIDPSTPSPAPPPSSPPPVNLCGAPANPWNFNFCKGGSFIADPPAAFCSYFPCTDNFWHNTNGFVVQCQDGLFSMAGGRPGACLHHGGVKRPLRR